MNQSVLIEANRSGYLVKIVRHSGGIQSCIEREGQPIPRCPEHLSQEIVSLMKTVSLAIEKAVKLFQVDKVVVSDRDLDILCNYYSQDDGQAASHFFSRLISIPNPQQYGTIRLYLAWLR